MTKKLISAAAAAAICSTAAMASQVLVVPAYFAGSGWSTDLEVYNTSNESVVAKVVLYKSTDSVEVRDFNIYLSGKDVWAATIKESSTAGSYVIESTDDSSPVEGSSAMASSTTPMSASVSVSNGYALIMTAGYIDINKTSATGTSSNLFGNTTDAYHGLHSDMRADYQKYAKAERGNLNDYTFTAGLIDTVTYSDFNYTVHASAATIPNQPLGASSTAAYSDTSTNTHSVVMADIVDQPLFGLVRMTNTTTGTDMVADMRSFNVSGASGYAPLWVEGEAASLRDINVTVGTIVQAITDSNTKVDNNSTTNRPGVQKVYLPYTANLESQTLILDPIKKNVLDTYATHVAATGTSTSATTLDSTEQVSLINTMPTYYTDATYVNSTSKVSSYGCFKAQLKVRDMSENLASSSAFSPAQTPVVKLCNELSVSENNSDTANNFSTYITQAGYAKGFVEVNFKEATGNDNHEFPFIITQMLATQPNSTTTVTNWFNPSIED